MKRILSRPAILISIVFFLLAILFFSPIQMPYKLAYPLAFLTLCALRYSSWPMVLAMGFSALGDYMGVCHNFWGQMGSFALAHIAFVVFFYRLYQQEKAMMGIKWKSVLVALYGLVVGMCIVPHVQGPLQIGVSVYILLILAMCMLAWMQKNPLYALGAWLFVFSDTILAWNKFVSPIEWAGYLIMVPYYLGQWVLFVQSVRVKQLHK
jgi:alkenylglycerophosphocholine/alkenylglycerophosphoethanolamine hydrolase